MGASGRARYDTVAIVIHWLTAALMIFMVFFGEELMDTGEEGEEAGELLSSTLGPSLHVSLGMAILGLTVLRILWRLIHQAPPYPATMRNWEIGLSKALHGLFYLLLIGIPLVGWLAFGAFLAEEPAMSAVRIFGALPVPASPVSGKWAKEIHELGSNLAMVLIGLHVLAALKHQFLDRDRIMQRMIPG